MNRFAAPSRTLVRGLVLLIDLYKAASPLLRPRCRYWPSCSDYAREALLTHGARRGASLAARRIARCHPFGDHGFDPVPAPGDPRAAGLRPGAPDGLRAALP
jgi:putative membrane protein insertion efficiency factor